ncbi:MAG: thymidine phosphorylase [Clostridia bacterium]|nr:thymidine phosphorylase [Clostridia bacterium]
MLSIYDIISKKRDKKELTKEEIQFVIEGFVNGSIKDYQMSALLMAIYINGMNFDETYYLTDQMKNSGKTLDLENYFDEITIDKHSTGGVGDKTSFVVCPILASFGIKVPKLSGRGLGHTGGTIDKLESIPGFKTSLSQEEIIELTKKVGFVISGQTNDITPADKLIYGLRDVTATVGSVPLIASSIMSKKLAAGCKVIIIDIKCGSGAFMKDYSEAQNLAKYMIEIGKRANKKVICEITNMDEPLGNAVGNSLEVIEAINTLKGKGPEDFTRLCIELSVEAIKEAFNISNEEVVKRIEEKINNGEAYNKLIEMVQAQGGDISYIANTEKFPKAKVSIEYKAETDGFIESINATSIGLAAMELGAGRKVKSDIIDFSTGIIFNKKCGDRVDKNTTILTLYTNNIDKLDLALEYVKSAIQISSNKPSSKKLILGKIQ